MKNKITVLFLFSVYNINAQHSTVDSVIEKLQKDDRSFKEYILLGKMNCYGNVAGLENEIDGNSILYFNMWTKLYNSLSPFTRLLNKEAVAKSIKDYVQHHKKEFDERDKNGAKKSVKESTYLNKIGLCDCLFSKKDSYKKQYVNLIKQKNNFIKATDATDSFSAEEIESFMKDYLNSYFIKIETE